MPRSTVIPVLAYPDVRKAVEWLCDAFGFTERLRIGEHRAQLNVGDGAVVIAARRAGPTARGAAERGDATHSVMVRVADVDRHHARAREHGARILGPPADFPYGERQYTVEDPGGHRWTFSQSVADIAPEDWGGVLVSGTGTEQDSPV
jgi:uncharacterized glyoxalase superfamily protein PhnB